MKDESPTILRLSNLHRGYDEEKMVSKKIEIKPIKTRLAKIKELSRDLSKWSKNVLKFVRRK